MICLHCQKALRGRTDKKFCDDGCRNNYNNKTKASTNNFIRNVNNALSRNRRIMAGILGEHDNTITSADELVLAGFQFRYFTHTSELRTGTTFCCYDHGYHFLENGEEVLLQRLDNGYQKKLG